MAGFVEGYAHAIPRGWRFLLGGGGREKASRTPGETPFFDHRHTLCRHGSGGEASGKSKWFARYRRRQNAPEMMAERLSSAIRYPFFDRHPPAGDLLFFSDLRRSGQFEPVFKDLGGRLKSGAALIVAAVESAASQRRLFLGIFVVGFLGAWLGLSRNGGRAGSSMRSQGFPGISGTDGRPATRPAWSGPLAFCAKNGVATSESRAEKILRAVSVTEHT